VYSAPWVLTGARPSTPGPAQAIADGAIALDGDTVVAAGPRAEVEALHGRGQRLDSVIFPALVNAHLHLEASHLAGRVPGGDGLAAWIQRFIAARAQTREAEAAMAAAAEELVSAGVAAVGDVTNTLDSLAPLAARGFAGTLFHEVFGPTPARLEAALAAAEAARARAAPPPGLSVAPSPHAVYSTPHRTIAALLAAGPASIHLAEDPAERSLCAEGTGDFARMLGALGAPLEPFRGLRAGGGPARSAVAGLAGLLRPRHLAVHCVDLDDADLADLSASGATVVLCPRSNLHIGGRLPRLEALLAAGVPLAIGTDSLASTPSLAPLAELTLLRREFPAVPAARLVPLAWRGDAVAAPHVGRLAPGRAPGVLAAPLEGAAPADPFEFLLAHGEERRPFTWLARQRPDLARHSAPAEAPR
jgi:cytosine/adenosine deaminase-related metal-dependent hydrolase